MNVSWNRRLMLGLALATALLAATSGWFYWHLTWLRIQGAWAAEQTHVFEDMRTQSSKSSDPTEVAGFLKYAAEYYPSGSKQEFGSFLDEIVERNRQDAVRDMIAILRNQTADDLGDDPQPWIEKYAGR